MGLYHARYNSARFLNGGAAPVILGQNSVKMRQSRAAKVLVFVMIMPITPSWILLASGSDQPDRPLK